MTYINKARVSEKALLDAITTVLSSYISETDPYILFNGLLDALLDITDSEYGFIGEVFYSENAESFVKSYATTNIAWSEQTKRLYEKMKRKGMLFSRRDCLYGAVLKTGQLVISNQPATDPRSCGLPVGHPPLNAFMGIPFYGGGELLGMVGIANRKGGYCKNLADSLHPFLVTCGNLIQAYRNNLKHHQVELELQRYQAQLLALEEGIPLGGGYIYNDTPPAVVRAGQSVLLTKKELLLLGLLVASRNLPVSYMTIEKAIWPNVVVGESSLRSLVRRVRNKLPELSIRTASGVGYMLEVKDGAK